MQQRFVSGFRSGLLPTYLAVLALFLTGAFHTAMANEPISKYIRQSAAADTVIVFVHGIMGDGISTWTSENNTYWPTMLTEDHTFDGSDIFVYSYPTGLLATLSIDELAENMRYVLASHRVPHYRKIVFLSHSMGGLVTRAYLLNNRDVAAHTLFTYFFSTPTTGSQIASIAQYLANNPQFNKMRSLNADDYLADLLRRWLHADFQFPSYCAYEKRPTYRISLVVEMSSAAALCTKPLDPIDADHIDIVKPASQNSSSYIAFKAAFGDATERIRGSIERNFDDVNTWSVSFTIGGILSAGPPVNSYLMIHRCDFANLSTTQKRVLDFQLQILTENNHHPDLILNTANIQFQPEKWSEVEVGRPNATLANPLVLEPNAFAEGIVEFAMNADQAIKYREILDHHLVKMYENSVFYVIDRRSGRTMNTKFGEHYNARTGDVWRAGCLPALPPGENGGC
jgi:pimeloyl-ACP methyl ester carboxylesterase